MNWKKFTIGITIVNLLGWGLLELWSKRYADMNVSVGAGFLIVLHLLGYYIIAIGSNVPSTPKLPENITPANCPGHDWQKHKYSDKQEQCTRCGAERGKSDTEKDYSIPF